jgi:Asp-tRNA(Asn)/Glu-tRNA(Gln) amidotransferase B subunit
VAATDDEPNAHTCPVCLGLPGALPVLNERVVEQGVRAALALGATVPPVSMFTRRHRFAPELPKGYRVTQFDRPLATRGRVQIGETPSGAPLTVALTSLRLDEEPGRAFHGRVAGAVALDYNLAGSPVLRIASAPEMHASAEGVAFARALRRLLRGAGASDARFADGSLRVRARLSVRRLGDTGLGTPCDVVGADSLPALRAALEQEFARQQAIVDGGGTVERRTMLWTGAGALAPAQAVRRGESPGYLPEPDLPPLVLTTDWIAEQQSRVPANQPARREHLSRTYALDEAALDVLTGRPRARGLLRGRRPPARRRTRHRRVGRRSGGRRGRVRRRSRHLRAARPPGGPRRAARHAPRRPDRAGRGAPRVRRDVAHRPPAAAGRSPRSDHDGPRLSRRSRRVRAPGARHGASAPPSAWRAPSPAAA